MKTILVTGANGQLGKTFIKYCSKTELKLLLTDYNELDITNFADVSFFCNKNKPDYILNFAAYTAVDLAESEKEKAFLINETGVANLCQVAQKNDAFLIHISTDFVFEGNINTPYQEDRQTNPLSVYGKSKKAGEKAILKSGYSKFMIIRTSWLYSEFNNNFFKTMIRLGKEKEELGVVFDQIGTPTYAKDLSEVILEIIETGNVKSGIYHYSNEGVASWYDFAVNIMNELKLKCKVKPLKTSEYPTPATRPVFSLLDKTRIKKEYQIQIPHWQESLKTCIKEYLNENN